ncbi:MAG: hypothetical protein M3Y26_09710 [Actinomycetota bacterium]|nr:hypothetical protein [Actinomycetota bacterium]
MIDACRGLTAAAVMLTGSVHLALWEQGFRDVETVGMLFLLNAVAALGTALAVLLWRHWIPLLAAVGLAAATAGAFWVSVVHGLAGVHETAGGVLQVTSQIAECAATGLGLTAMTLLHGRGPGLERRPGATHPPLARPHVVDGGRRG